MSTCAFGGKSYKSEGTGQRRHQRWVCNHFLLIQLERITRDMSVTDFYMAENFRGSRLDAHTQTYQLSLLSNHLFGYPCTHKQSFKQTNNGNVVNVNSD